MFFVLVETSIMGIATTDEVEQVWRLLGATLSYFISEGERSSWNITSKTLGSCYIETITQKDLSQVRRYLGMIEEISVYIHRSLTEFYLSCISLIPIRVRFSKEPSRKKWQLTVVPHWVGSSWLLTSWLLVRRQTGYILQSTGSGTILQQ